MSTRNPPTTNNDAGNEDRATSRASKRKAMRTALREQRQSLSSVQQQKAAAALIDSVVEVPQWEQAESIALYAAFDGEIDPASLATFAQSAGKQVYLPVIDGTKTLRFGLWHPDQSMTRNRYGIEQPAADSQRVANEIDMVCVPLVAFDLTGNRLGMGGGYYDRALAENAKATTVGLAHTCQLVESIAIEAWDVPLHYIATDTALHRIAR